MSKNDQASAGRGGDMWNAAMESRAYDLGVERGESLRSVRSRLDGAGPAFVAHAREVIDGSRLDETFVDATATHRRCSRTAACSGTS